MQKSLGPVLVTGGGGFIGQHLVGRLRERGERVIAVDNLSGSAWRELGSEFEVRDVLALPQAICKASEPSFTSLTARSFPRRFTIPLSSYTT